MQLRKTMLLLGLGTLAACAGESPAESSWSLDHSEENGTVLSVWGSSPEDVWAAGGRGDRGLVLRNDGTAWTEIQTGAPGLLRWIYGFSADDIYAVGDDGLIVHYDGKTWEQVDSGTRSTLYGVWGSSADDVWIVGGDSTGPAGSAVVLRGSGRSFESVPALSSDLLPSALYKIYGAPGDIMAVGSKGTVLRGDGENWRFDDAPTTESIFSLWGRGADDIYAVGGSATGEVLHFDGSSWNHHPGSDEFGRGLSGVFTAPGQPTIAVGHDSYVVELHEDGSELEPALPPMPFVPSLHGVWGDQNRTTYAVGGDPLHQRGIILRRTSLGADVALP